MPTRKISEREKLTMWAREASDEALDTALEILSIEKRIRSGKKPTANTGTRKRTRRETPPGPPNPPKPDNDQPQG